MVVVAVFSVESLKTSLSCMPHFSYRKVCSVYLFVHCLLCVSTFVFASMVCFLKCILSLC